MNNNPTEKLSVKGLFNPKTQYVVPIYQRNYAWGSTEIVQLLQDICDAAGIGVESNQTEQQQYYLGSLVVYRRKQTDPSENTVFETIDGQQRHTTLSILLAFLKNQKLNIEGLEDLKLNLAFDSRPKSTRALKDIYKNTPTGESEERSILSAYTIIEEFFDKQELDGCITAFGEYLLNKVIILRVEVPPETDLNHYFEIMNNRGEQLEKHEVLKAKFMSQLSSESERSCFASIWDACADMKRYVQLGVPPKVRHAIFGDNLLQFPDSFSDIHIHMLDCNEKLAKEHGGTSETITLKSIIKQKAATTSNTEKEWEKEERFDSIIDFSNFLLHVLKLMKPNDGISLDDKKLLDAFGYKESKLVVDPSGFIFNLLKYRVLFDRFIIKRDSEKWSLLTLERYDSKSFSYPTSFGKDQSIALNDQLTMILAMFHVSNPTMAYKRWLNDTLAILAELSSNESNLSLDGQQYLSRLEALSKTYFNSICADKGVENLNKGTAVHNFVFNYLDYLLWCRLTKDESLITSQELRKHFNAFQFTTSRTSVEHYFPRKNPAGAKPMKDVDRFGNLCLISPRSNSRLNNYSPNDKKSFYRENNCAESLKQAMMMEYDHWGPDEPGRKNIVAHEEEMLNLLSILKPDETKYVY